MAIGSGLGGSLGIGVQSAYATREAPATFFKARTFSVNKTYERVQGEGIQASVYGDLLDHFEETINGAEATIGLDVPSRGFGKFLNTLMGGTVTATQIGTTGAYTQTHTLADPLGKFLTVQVGAPYRGGTVAVQELVGGKVISAEFECDISGLLTANLQIDGQKFDASQSLAAPSYVSSQVFSGKTAVFAVGSSIASASAVSGVRSFTCQIERSQDTEDYTFNASGRKSEPVLNGPTTISGSITVDWLDSTLQGYVENNTSTAVEFYVTARTAISGTYVPTFKISIPSVTWTGDMQGVDGRDVLQSTWDWTWKYDGTNLPYITYVAADSSI